MSKNRTKSVSLDNNLSTKHYIALIILCIAAAVVPLIVHAQKVDLKGDYYKYWTGVDYYYDFFSGTKSLILQFCLVAAILYLLYLKSKKYKLSLSKIFIPLALYTFGVIISTLSSQHSEVAWKGLTDRWEGCIVLLAYVMLTILATLCIKSESSVKILMIALGVSCFFMAVIGLTQFYGVDFLQTPLGIRLMLPHSLQGIADSLKFQFAGQKVMYSTVYNPNYLGSYSVLVLPVAIGLFYEYAGKKLWKVILSILFVASAFVLWLGGMSRAGLIGGLFMFVFLMIFLFKRIIKAWRSSLVLFGMMIAIYIVMDTTSGGLVSKEFYNTLPSSLQNAINVKGSQQENVQDSPQQNMSRLTKFELKDSVLTFGTQTETLVMTYKDEYLAFADGNNNTILPIKNGDIITLADDKYSLYSVVIETDGIRLKYGDYGILFLVDAGKMKLVASKSLIYDEVCPIPSVGFKGSEEFGSGRGFIWSRSIPLLKDTILLGHGPDTFPMFFPQQDMAGKINGLKNAAIVVDKPHNWYLQIGISIGVIYLLAMITFLLWFVLKGIKLWLKDDSSFKRITGVVIMSAIIGYCVAALFNDSNVAVAPVFWVLLGTGTAIMYGNKKSTP